MIVDCVQKYNPRKHLSIPDDEIYFYATAGVKESDILVLMVLRICSGERGYTFVTTEQIASSAGVGKNAVGRAMRSLQCLGFIEHEIMKDGRGLTFVSDNWKGGAK